MIHGWPLLFPALTVGSLLWGSICHHVERKASRFIPSIGFLDQKHQAWTATSRKAGRRREDTIMTGRKREMRQDLKQTFLWSLGLALLLTLALALGPSAALAQGPGPNQAFLYELSENAALYNQSGNVL